MRSMRGAAQAPVLSSPLPLLVALMAALLAGGCASSKQQTADTGWYVAGPRPETVAVRPAQPREPTLPTEGDGLPPQAPPLKRPQPLPDDPREPWSPNYGSVPVKKT
ncbi:MAG: hypothetical protein KDJ41_02390 [Hyphomicrobiaceae bacterium]|nr:hypothetical protein [Hyphomicrobiaceae bacterium]